jgi:hypothetical protein
MDSLIRPVGTEYENVRRQTSARNEVGTTLCEPAKRELNWLWIAGLAFSLSFWATFAYLVITWCGHA